MNTLKRIFKNIQWLLNHPPTNVIYYPTLITFCDYCRCPSGNTNFVTNYIRVFSICSKCMQKAFDKVLKRSKK